MGSLGRSLVAGSFEERFSLGMESLEGSLCAGSRVDCEEHLSSHEVILGVASILDLLAFFFLLAESLVSVIVGSIR